MWPVGDTVELNTADNSVDWSELNRVINAHFDDSRLKARAVLIVKDGRIVYEKYGDKHVCYSMLIGWSATKSVINALIGIMIKKNMIKHGLESLIKTFVPEWKGANQLTLRDMLQMVDGTDFDEFYEPGYDVTTMLFNKKSTLFPMRDKRTAIKKMSCWQYNSHTTNVISLYIRRVIESLHPSEAKQIQTEIYHNLPRTLLFDRIHAKSFMIETDPSDTFIGSSFGWATARDWARLGLLFLNKGNWFGEQIFSEDWVEFSTKETKTSLGRYGAHVLYKPDRSWWDKAFPKNSGTFAMHGFESQMIAIVPSKDLVVVRLGCTKEVVLNWDRIEFYSTIVDAFPNVDE
eukprot:GSMAST32.ASY1.ANO1.163.1 assembled CDS